MQTFQEVIDSARFTLNDSEKVRYPDLECYGYAIDALSEIALARPDLFAVVGDITCVAGVEQSIPDDGWFLVDVFGIKNGVDVTECDYGALRSWNPNWRTETAGPIEHFMRYPESMRQQQNNRFLCFPPAIAGQVLRASWVQLNRADFTLSGPVPVPLEYMPAVKAYIIYRAETKDDEHVNTNRAAQFRAAFNSMLGVGEQSEMVAS